MFNYGVRATQGTSRNVDFDHNSGVLMSPAFPYPQPTNETRDTVDQLMLDTFRQAIPPQILSEFAAKGIQVSSVNLSSITLEWVYVSSYTAYVFPMVPITLDRYKAKIVWEVTFDTDTSLSGSPFLGLTWEIVTKILSVVLTWVVVALIGYWTIQALKDFLTSLFTETYEIIEYYPDGTIKRKETGRKPSPIAEVIGAVVVVSVLSVVLLWFVGKPKAWRKTGRKR